MSQVPAWLKRGSAPELGFSEAGLVRITDAFNALIDERRLPGITAMVVRRGRLAYCEALGLRDPAAPEPMQLDTLFRIYSMTKPVVSVAVMMLFEQGKLLLDDPVEKFLPPFKATQLGIEHGQEIELVAPARSMTVQDLLRHTAGLTYEILSPSPIRKLYAQARVNRIDWTSEEFLAKIAGLPLKYQPGEVWEYSRATDVLGRLVEVVSGMSLGAFLQQHILTPLGMSDTGFHVPAPRRHRLAEPYATDPDTGAAVKLLDVGPAGIMEMGGAGLVSTLSDYARFVQMLINGGTLDGQRILGRKTVQLMSSDHLGKIPSVCDLLPPGHGFGLGFAVKLHDGVGPTAGSAGLYYWGGIAGTTFFIDPKEELYAVMMAQAPGMRDEIRPLFRNLVYAALE